MIRPHEHLTLYPALARPLGRGTWQATLHALLCVPHADSLKRKLFIRTVARAAGVAASRHDAASLPYLRDRLAPFLVDNKSRRRVEVELAGRRITLGPSARNGHLSGIATFQAPAAATTLEYATTPGESPGRRFTGLVHLIPQRGLSIVSDIDDTIKHSNVPDTRDLLRNTFLRAHVPIAPIRALYTTLSQHGAAFHYVSASPWQLYTTLSDFITQAALPRGSFHLKPFRVKDRSGLSLLAPPDRFKLGAIRPLLDAWPRRRFVLVGDSAERDPEIYGALARERPRQIAAILIRDIGPPAAPDRYQSAFKSVPRAAWRVCNDNAWSATTTDLLRRIIT